MRFKNLLLSLSILFLGTGLFPKVQACELFDLVITKTNCNPDKKFAVKINFGYRDAGDFLQLLEMERITANLPIPNCQL